MFPIVKVRRQVTAVPCRELFCIMTAYHVPCWHIPSSPSRYISLCQHVKTFMFSYSISHCIVQSLTMSLQKITSQGFSFFFFSFSKDWYRFAFTRQTFFACWCIQQGKPQCFDPFNTLFFLCKLVVCLNRWAFWRLWKSPYDIMPILKPNNAISTFFQCTLWTMGLFL